MTTIQELRYAGLHERMGLKKFDNYLADNKEKLKEAPRSEVIFFLKQIRDTFVKSEETKESINSFLTELDDSDTIKEEKKEKSILDTKLGQYMLKNIPDGKDKEKFRTLTNDQIKRIAINEIIKAVNPTDKNEISLIENMLLDDSNWDNDLLINAIEKAESEQIATINSPVAPVETNHSSIVPIVVKDDSSATVTVDLQNMFSQENQYDLTLNTMFDFSSLNKISEKHIKKEVKSRIIKCINNSEFASELLNNLGDDITTNVQFKLSSFEDKDNFTIVSTTPRLFNGQQKYVYFKFSTNGGMFEVR